jgi:large subunit ribosomal protein L28
MSRRCGVTGKGVMTGHNVSHANNKSPRKFLPNLQRTSMLSDALGQMIRLRLSTNAIRTIERNGGLDAYLLKARSDRLSLEFRRIKTRIQRRLEAKAAA